jgi:hypothetical protein
MWTILIVMLAYYDVAFFFIISAGAFRGEPGSSVGIMSGYGLDNRAIEVRSPVEAKGFFLVASVSRPTLAPTQPPVQWVPEVLSAGLKRGGA